MTKQTFMGKQNVEQTLVHHFNGFQIIKIMLSLAGCCCFLFCFSLQKDYFETKINKICVFTAKQDVKQPTWCMILQISIQCFNFISTKGTELSTVPLTLWQCASCMVCIICNSLIPEEIETETTGCEWLISLNQEVLVNHRVLFGVISYSWSWLKITRCNIFKN